MILPVLKEQPDEIADYSYISAISSCPRFAYYAFERSLAPSEGSKSVALVLGNAIHAGVDWLYTHDWDIEGAINVALEAFGDFSLPPTHKHAYVTPGHVEIILRNYLDDRRNDDVQPILLRAENIRQDNLVTPLVTDERGYIRLIESPVAIRFGSLIYGGKLDLPNITGDSYAIWDHKTSRMWLSEHWVRRYANSHQMRGYILLMRELTGLPFDRIYINAIYTGREAADAEEAWKKRKTKRSTLFGPFVYSKQMLQETQGWVKRWLELRDLFRRQAEQDGEEAWPQNDRNCFKFNDPCVYYDICSRSPHIREAIIRAKYVVRNFNGLLASGADSDEE